MKVDVFQPEISFLPMIFSCWPMNEHLIFKEEGKKSPMFIRRFYN